MPRFDNEYKKMARNILIVYDLKGEKLKKKNVYVLTLATVKLAIKGNYYCEKPDGELRTLNRPLELSQFPNYIQWFALIIGSKLKAINVKQSCSDDVIGTKEFSQTNAKLYF